MIYVILGTMLVGDIVWWYCAHRFLRDRRLRVSAGVFAAAQLAGLISIMVSRKQLFDLDSVMPRWVYSCILVWHLVVLMPWLVWRVATGIVAFAKWLAKRWIVPRIDDVSGDSDPVLSPEEGVGMSRRAFFSVAATFTPPLLTLGAAGVGETQLDDFRVRHMEIPIANLPSALDGITIAHVTDVHVGRFTRGAVLERMVEETNRLNADIVAMTGDLINDSLRAMPAALDLVRGFRARHMVVTCEGNHDLIESPPSFYREAERGGLPLLRGDAAAVTINGHKLQVLGMPWSRGNEKNRAMMAALLAKRDPAAWHLLLAHHPHVWDLAQDIPLTLAGHTHGGQLMLNDKLGCGPVMYRYWSGLYRRDGSALAVSNGVGNWFPVRIQAPAEILHLTLRRG